MENHQLNNHMRESIFVLMKQAMKAKKMTYAELGKHLGVGELAVKRLFRDKDCKLSRIFEVCEFLGVELEDLLAMQKRQSQKPEFLPESIEQALANDLTLFTVFILLVSEVNLSEVQRVTGHDEPTLYLIMRRLEKLGLIHLLPNNQFRFNVPLPIRWRFQGALSKVLKPLNLNFLAYCFDRDEKTHHQFITMSRFLSQASLEELQREADSLRQRFEYLASQDRLFFSTEQLKLVKMVIAQGPFPILDIVPKDKGNA